MTNKEALEKYSVEEYTHWLDCKHCIGRSCSYYRMRCIVLSESGERAKVLVFGDRNWKDKEHINAFGMLKELGYIKRINYEMGL